MYGVVCLRFSKGRCPVDPYKWLNIGWDVWQPARNPPGTRTRWRQRRTWPVSAGVVSLLRQRLIETVGSGRSSAATGRCSASSPNTTKPTHEINVTVGAAGNFRSDSLFALLLWTRFWSPGSRSAAARTRSERSPCSRFSPSEPGHHESLAAAEELSPVGSHLAPSHGYRICWQHGFQHPAG